MATRLPSLQIWHCWQPMQKQKLLLCTGARTRPQSHRAIQYLLCKHQITQGPSITQLEDAHYGHLLYVTRGQNFHKKQKQWEMSFSTLSFGSKKYRTSLSSRFRMPLRSVFLCLRIKTWECITTNHVQEFPLWSKRDIHESQMVTEAHKSYHHRSLAKLSSMSMHTDDWEFIK